MSDIPKYDERLWFTIGEHCAGQHFILGNPHTFPGRMMAWCPRKGTSFFFSKREVETASAEAMAWIDGFLAGNEPAPPVAEDGDVDFASDAYKQWTQEVERFHETGMWSRRS
jgi:hypothetical protein